MGKKPFGYERLNPKGFLMRVYRNMWSRVVGIQRREARYYEGLPILPKPVFYAWALATNSAFWPLWTTWQASQRNRKLTPSIDRLDATKGYVLSNMQWLTHSANSAKVSLDRRRKSRLDLAACSSIYHQHRAGVSMPLLALKYGVSLRTAYRAFNKGLCNA